MLSCGTAFVLVHALDREILAMSDPEDVTDDEFSARSSPDFADESEDAAPEQNAISWRRVAVSVCVAMALLVPALFSMESSSPGCQTLCESKSVARAGQASQRKIPFDVSGALVPLNEIRSGGPPKDGIPALTNPAVIAASEVDFLQENDRVIGLLQDNLARAYPLKILNYHEIVNDSLGEISVAVTYCPLCDSAAAFDRLLDERPVEFGVSGLLYNSNVLMYDRSQGVESLWSQVKAKAIAGPCSGDSLEALPFELTTWSAWQSRYPDTTVMSIETGHLRRYDRNPYRSYFESDRLMFPAQPEDSRLPAKQRVLGAWSGDQTLAVPASAFSESRPKLDTTLDGKRLSVEFEADCQTMRVVAAEDGIQWMYSFWFAWSAMHPETQLYEIPQ